MTIIQVPRQPSSSVNSAAAAVPVDSNKAAEPAPKQQFFTRSFWLYFLLFSLVNIFAALINHIDDTDETYGYWEPLHYLLFGRGMQTWEYSPEYAIRSYAFLHPFYLIGMLFQFLARSKLMIFYGIRIWIGALTATAEAALIQAVEQHLSSPAVARMMTIFLLSAPGVFFASTSFLPSALAMSLFMHTLAAWLNGHFLSSIIWGGIAVMWTGWPFVALLYIPIGLHMMYKTSIPKGDTRYFKAKAKRDVTVLIISAVILVAILTIPVVIIDLQYYGKLTVPALNIFLYNAVGSSTGDELYGVEPASYYVKNLLLNTGITWPIALLSIPVIGLDYLLTKRVDLNSELLTVFACLLLWLGVMFSRPHKEERFLYPVYPLIIYVASVSIVSGISILETIYSKLFANKEPSEAEKNVEKKPLKLKALSHVVAVVVTLLSVGFGYARIAANMRNYSGYIKLWSLSGDYIAQKHPDLQQPVNVCVGFEWYHFPSHFFLPANAQLAFIEDGFHGILPQPFAAENGTQATPLQAFNNLNREEKSRYIPREQCDYVIQSNSEGVTEEVGQFCSASRGKVVLQQAVLLGAKEGNEWARAFEVPTLSHQFVNMKAYQFAAPTCD